MMWDVVELAEMPRAPHEVIFADEDGWSASDRFQFDRMILTFKRWVANKKAETVPYTPEKDAEPQKPKYQSMYEIWDEYDSTADISKFASLLIPDIDVDAVIEDAFGDDVLF